MKKSTLVFLYSVWGFGGLWFGAFLISKLHGVYWWEVPVVLTGLAIYIIGFACLSKEKVKNDNLRS